ncbi:rRNA pseudouridine synthase [Clostridium botulinum]|uniref:Pseudouridine synthase n=1 Tax=Clostridium botulinum C/D str. DC5 TaxID=1443128 RepID=A0A0A0IH15_CLOBO|nr:pseudouridine synthase [Clostridium botulinum]KEI00198.1 pseudouridine synthase [Clostridium botulinum C/D str. BKT75002]KEI09356.1 pseudouridine synthase [Clostridium botulinum C/D str. BKT2873]KGM94669.1 pseudouridine synthase [Clostridium botulinum D str. CCUG 7971]KGM99888.1 pseudouridine synthase [Clostridium botulinum C/D str. DC5]KOC49407.1 pseudouridine synthase [Clostridium botulinum]
MERLDKILSNLGYGSRKEIKALVKKGEIEIDGEIIKDNGAKVDPNKSIIKVSGEEINYRKYIYLMMNKPAGVVSATFDNYDETVIDLLDHEYTVFDPFPVGRLDKDTEGFLLITNDGDLNHRLTSPKWHVDKIYYAEIDKIVNEKDIKAFEKGVVLDDGYRCLPAKLDVLFADENGSEVNITIQEGKFHQVKRMFEARDKKVIYLKRLQMGNLVLDDSLSEGEYRELTEDEVKVLKSI